MKHVFAAALAGSLLVGATSASAVTTQVSAGDFIILQQVFAPGQEVEFEFQAAEELNVSNISISIEGFAGGADIGLFRFGLTSPASVAFSNIEVADDGFTSTATAFLPVGVLENDEFFSLFGASGASANINVAFQAVFSAAEVAPIPLPASLPLALAGLGLMGFVARRRKQSV